MRRDSTCTFQFLPGLTRTAALKSEVAQLRTNSNNLLQLYRQLRDGSAVDAWNLVEKIRSGEVAIDVPPNANLGQRSISWTPPRPSGLVDALDIAISGHGGKMSLPAIPLSQGTSSTSHVTKQSTASQRHLVKVPDRGTTEEAGYPVIEWRIEEPLSYQMFGRTGAEFSTLMHGEENNDVSLRHSLRENLDKIQEGFHMQQHCISEIFFCHSMETFKALMSRLDQDGAEPLKVSVLCEFCAVATIAGQYVQEALEPGLLDQWYSKSKLRAFLIASIIRADIHQVPRASVSMTARRLMWQAPSGLLQCWACTTFYRAHAWRPVSLVSFLHSQSMSLKC